MSNNRIKYYLLIAPIICVIIIIVAILHPKIKTKTTVNKTNEVSITSTSDSVTVSVDGNKVSSFEWEAGFPKHGDKYHECVLGCLLIDDSLDGNIENTFDYVYPKFKVFNNNIDTMTTNFFIGVMDAYNLDRTPYHRQMYTGQILSESGAKQHYDDGRLVVSSGNAIGFCQIVPSTCQWLLETYADSTDISFMKSLGATDFTFMFDKSVATSIRVAKAKIWLSDITNNIIMWGFLTNHSLLNKGDIHVQLVSYNMGDGGCRKYIRNGGNVCNHHYIKGILNKLNYAKSHS